MASRPRTTFQSFKAELYRVYAFEAPARRIESAMPASDLDLLFVMLAGSYKARWEEGGQSCKFQAGPGEVVYWPAGAARIEVNDPPAPRCKNIGLVFRWLNRAPGLPHKVNDRHGTIRNLVETAMTLQSFPHPQRQLILNGYLSAILAEYCRLAEHEGENPAGRVTRYVYDHIREHIGLEDLARYVGMSPRQLEREYKALTGETPMQVVRRIRLEKAARIVWQTDRPLKNVALSVGICDEDELSKQLKKFTGMTVRQLRASCGDAGPDED